MKALVTGAAGFIGSQYVRTLLSSTPQGSDDMRVTVLDRSFGEGLASTIAWCHQNRSWWQPPKASGSTTRYGLARAAFELSGLDPARIRPATSDRSRRPARRPAFSVLGHQAWARAGVAPLGRWRPMLAEALRRPYVAELQRGAR